MTFKKCYLHHTFHQAVKVSDELETMLQQFWNNNLCKVMKDIDFAWHEVMVIIMNRFRRILAHSFEICDCG